MFIKTTAVPFDFDFADVDKRRIKFLIILGFSSCLFQVSYERIIQISINIIKGLVAKKHVEGKKRPIKMPRRKNTQKTNFSNSHYPHNAATSAGASLYKETIPERLEVKPCRLTFSGIRYAMMHN